MKPVRILIWIILGAAVVLIAGGLCAWLWMAPVGGTELEQWIGAHLIGVIEAHITPRLTWERLDYRAPLTVVIDHPRLERAGLPILTIKRMTLGLARLPRQNEPVLVERIEMESPEFHFQTDPSGTLIGWSDFVRADVQHNPQSITPGRRLSDALRLKRVEVRDARVTVQSADDAFPMSLPGISATVDTPPDEGDPGWYRVRAAAWRAPLFDLKIDGRFHTDTFAIELDPLRLSASMDAEQYALFPPRLQTVLRAHAARGKLDVQARGRVDAPDWAGAQLSAQVQLQEGSLTAGRDPLTVRSLSIEAELANRAFSVRFEGASFGGRGSGRLQGVFDGSSPMDFELTVQEIDADGLVAVIWAHPPPGFGVQGRVGGEVRGGLPKSGWKDGNVQAQLAVRNAHLKLGPVSAPVPKLELKAALQEGDLTFDYHIDVFSGTGSGQGRVGLHGSRPMELTWTVAGAELREILVAFGQEPHGLSGRLRSAGSVALETAQATATLEGSADGTVEEADLVNIPLISGLLDIVRPPLALIPFVGMGRGDRASFRCGVHPDHLEFSEMTVQCEYLIARGRGRVDYNGALDLMINAGPIEKMESMMGILGELLSKVSDRLVAYKVSGTLSEPRFEPRPLGIGG